MQVARAVVAHRIDIDSLEHVERLQHHRALLPLRQLEDLDAFVVRRERFLDLDLPAGQIVHGEEAALLARAAHDLLRDVALVEAFVHGLDGVLARAPRFERRLFCLDEFAQGRGQIGLPENLAGLRRFARLPGVRQEHGRRVLPLLDFALLALHGVGGLRVDGVAVGQAMAGASTCASESVPNSASITSRPPGVPGVTAASGPYSGG